VPQLANNSAMNEVCAELTRRGFLSMADLPIIRNQMRRAPVPQFKAGTFVRGLLDLMGHPIKGTSKEERQYTESFQKALSPLASPGSYLVPIIQPEGEITPIFGSGWILRKGGARIWDMNTIAKQTVPTELANPQMQYLAPNANQTPDSTLNFGQYVLEPRTARALVKIPIELLKTASVTLDTVLDFQLRNAAGKFEDLAFLTGVTAADASPVPNALINQFVNILTPKNGAGAPLDYHDITSILAQAYASEIPEPYAWFFHPLVFFNQVLGMLDTLGRPIVQRDASENGVRFSLFGHPVYLSPRIPVTLGSPAVYSYFFLTNPSYVNIGSSDIEVAVSDQFAFDAAQITLRLVMRNDVALAPLTAAVAMEGVLTT